MTFHHHDPFRSPSPPSYPTTGSNVLMGRIFYQRFLSTRSRVIRIFNLPENPVPHLIALLQPPHTPVSLWRLREEWGGSTEHAVWVVFRKHEQALAALGLSGGLVSIATALETDLEPFQKLKKVNLTSQALPLPLPPCSDPHAFTLSSNPPNPRHAFRPGDWMCPVPACGAHNFTRNTTCIGCRAPRSSHLSPLSRPRLPAAPRFHDAPFSEFIKFDANTPPRYAERAPITVFNSFSSLADSRIDQTIPHTPDGPTLVSSPNLATLHINELPFILTPSGRARAIGVKYRNVSKDALNPCILLWPDNESFPSQGQVRPLFDMGPQLPPIMNTGNKGPIALQPGDWLCSECKYVNWRRRKVCEMCYPYADGNSDGVATSVQAERIALARKIYTTCYATDSVDLWHPEDTIPWTPCTSIGSKSPVSAKDASLRRASSSSSLSITGSQSIWTLGHEEVPDALLR